MTGQELDEAARRLEACGHRATPRRIAVLAALMARRTYVTARDLHLSLLRVQPRLGQATVYRTLELLVDCGLAETFPQPNNELRYAFCSARHHHHLVCKGCGLVAEVPGCALQPVERELERQSRFAISDHALTFFGTCQECRAESPVEPPVRNSP